MEYKCKFCTSSFFSHSDISQHFEEFHRDIMEQAYSRGRAQTSQEILPKKDENKMEHSCGICWQKFPSKKSLLKHIYEVHDDNHHEFPDELDDEKDQSKIVDSELEKNIENGLFLSDHFFFNLHKYVLNSNVKKIVFRFSVKQTNS